MHHTPHQLLLFTWGGVACKDDAADRQATSTCEPGLAPGLSPWTGVGKGRVKLRLTEQ